MFVPQEPSRDLNDLLLLWQRPVWIAFASCQIVAMWFIFALTRSLSPEWRGLRHWYAQCTSSLYPGRTFCVDEQTAHSVVIVVVFFVFFFLLRHACCLLCENNRDIRIRDAFCVEGVCSEACLAPFTITPEEIEAQRIPVCLVVERGRFVCAR